MRPLSAATGTHHNGAHLTGLRPPSALGLQQDELVEAPLPLMKRLLIIIALLSAAPANALSVNDYVQMQAASQRGDKRAAERLESYVAGVTETILTAHAMRPIPGLCFPKGVEIRVRDVYPMAVMVINTSVYRRLNLDKVPFAKAVIDGFSMRYPCDGP